MNMNETPHPVEVELPSAGEVKKMKLGYKEICEVINKFRTELNFELHLVWTKRREHVLDVVYGVRPGPSFDYHTEEWAITDGKVELLKHQREYDYPTTNDDIYTYKIVNYSTIIIFQHYDNSWDNVDENSITVIATDKSIIRKIAQQYEEYGYLDNGSKKYLRDSFTKNVSFRLTGGQYEMYQEFRDLLISKFREMLDNIVKLEWDPIKGFKVNGEEIDDERVQPYLDVIDKLIDVIPNVWENIGCIILGDMVPLKVVFFVDVDLPNTTIRVYNRNVKVLKPEPEIIKDAYDAIRDAFSRALEEAKEKKIDVDSEEFDSLFYEWLPSFLKFSSPEDWGIEYK